MPSTAILDTGDQVVAVANDVSAGSAYRADTVALPCEGRSGPRRDDVADTLLLVERGLIEMMVEGATGYLDAGEFARVPAGYTYAFRNAGSTIARVLSVRVRNEPKLLSRTAVRVTIAAA